MVSPNDSNEGVGSTALSFDAGDGPRLTKRLVSLIQGRILGLMGTDRTALLPVREGEIWRVQIVWPNDAVHHFGKFISKEDAVHWIAAHSHLTMPAGENTKTEP